MYKYIVFGLKVLSDIKLECYTEDFENADVCIKSTCDKELANCWVNESSKSFFTIDFPFDFGRVYISGLDCMVIQYNNQEGLNFISYEILECPFSIMLMLRGSFVLHGNTILYQDSGIVLVGDSGAGKSSLSAGFLKIGGKILSDDISRIQVENGMSFAYPSYPSFKLWKHTAEKFSIDLSSAHEVEYNKNKFMVKDSRYFSQEKAQVSSIIYMERMSVMKLNSLKLHFHQLCNVY